MSVALNKQKPEDVWIRRLVTLNGRIYAETGTILSPRHTILDSSCIGAKRQLHEENVDFISTPIYTCHMQPTSTSEFLPANCEALGDHHQVWSVVVQRDHDCFIRLLIPALVLIRALLPLGKYSHAPFIGRSPHELLHKPPDYVFAQPKIALSPAAKKALDWVTLSPYAMKIWNEVKNNACHGRIAISLPPMRIHAAMRGFFNGKTAFIQDMHIRSIVTRHQLLSDLKSSFERTTVYGRCLADSYYSSIPNPASEVQLGIREGHRAGQW